MTCIRRSIRLIARNAALATLAAGLCLAATGCAGRRSYQATSVVRYLYPENEERVEQAAPRLALPLRVGIAFVPEEEPSKLSIPARDKLDLMEKLAAQFKQDPFVKRIELIPSLYLTPKGGLDDLDNIAAMFDIDVIALLSYEQVQHTDEDLRSIGYWTVAGIWAVRGELNDTSTMLDAAVFHIPSRRLLFRAPGTSRVKGRSTPVNLTEQLRKDAGKGLEEAEAQLVANLKEQLEEFRAKLKNAPGNYLIDRRPGYSGGGNVGG